MKLFKLITKRRPKSVTIRSSVQVPLKVVVVQGKYHVVGIGELGDKHAEVERLIFPFLPIGYDVEKVAEEVLRKLGIPENEIKEIMQYAVEEEL